MLHLNMQSQRLSADERGFAIWEKVISPLSLPGSKIGLILCDVWDQHWCRGAAERVELLVPRTNAFVRHARQEGIWIVHAPSETMRFYAQAPARQRMRALTHLPLPHLQPHVDPPLPIDDADGGCDTGEPPWHKAWTRQHPALEIDQERDGITDDIHEIYSFILQKGIELILIAGVHTNMCILNRSFGIKHLVRLGLRTALVRDLTDAMYNPAASPYVEHAAGTGLVIEYIEKFWCPTIESAQITR